MGGDLTQGVLDGVEGGIVEGTHGLEGHDTCCSAARKTSSACASVAQKGFSTMTCLPPAMQARACS